MRRFLLLPLIALALAACDDGVTDYSGEDSRNDLCMFTWYGIGVHPTFVTDDGDMYEVMNAVNLPLKADSAYRMSVLYSPYGDAPGTCSLQGFGLIPILGDSSRVDVDECNDKVAGVRRVWMGGGFINLTLEYRYDGVHNGLDQPVLQHFGYRVDNLVPRTATTPADCTISIFFRQDGGRQHEYLQSSTFSISPDSLKLKPGDHLTIHAAWRDVNINNEVDEGEKDFEFEI